MQTNKSNGALTAQINIDDHKKSGFDLSNNVLGTGKIGRIIPTRALHVMPNDTIKADSKVAVQFEPLAVPILANMDVKQEHFYVPYNIVWKNWDKFISGGEKMDYKGVVPNVSLIDIVKATNDYLITDETGGFPIYIGNETAAPTISVDVADFDTALDSIKSQLDNTGQSFEIRDLLKPQYEAIKLLRALLETYSAQGSPRVEIFKLSYPQAQDSGNKYYEQIKPALVSQSEQIYKPTDEGNAILELIYEFYKPLIGIGSNIDYLNMGRFTYADFLYLVCQYVYKVVEILRLRDKTVYFVIDTEFVSNKPISILNLRANYNIWYNNYRDVLLEANAPEPVDTDMVTMSELFTLLVPRQRCWEKDAFTTALDNPGTGNVSVLTQSITNHSATNYEYYRQEVLGENPVTLDGNNIYKVEIDGQSWRLPTAYLSGINQQDGEYLDESSGFSLYQLDAAQRAQKWLQKALYFGNRISDFYYLRFGVRFLDARLRLPELLTSSSELVKLDVVMNNTNITTEVGGEVYQSIAGDRAAYASAYDNGNSFERYCEEHGVIMSYLTIMPQVTYAYGMNRDYSRLDQFDFAFSEFATLGMDAVYDNEITSCPVNLPDDTFSNDVFVFGYQGKYYDYKAKHSEEHGELLDSQDMYTFARKFNMYDPDGRPKLNYEFVHCFPDLDMFVVNSSLSDYFRYDIRHSTAAERNLPSQSIYI